MIEAPYTPATLRAIKQGASASQLGWTPARYLSLCRKHNLQPVADAAPVDLSAILYPSIAAHQLAPALPKYAAHYRPQRKPRPTSPMPSIADMPKGDPHWDAQTGEFRCDDVVVIIAGRVQSKALTKLFNRWSACASDYVRSRHIAEAADTGHDSICVSIRDLARNIRRAGWCIESRRGAGYRLARVTS